MVNSRKDYGQLGVRAAHSVLLELVRMLGEYRNDIVVVGGWVPSFHFDHAEEKHVGSTDVDIALNHKTIDNQAYQTIHDLLVGRGYVEGKQPFIFFRTLRVDEVKVKVEVDLLGGEYAGTGKGHRTQTVQDIRIRKARGCELAFEQQDEKVVEGVLPNGGKDRASVRVAGIVPFIVMKAMALHDRIKEKDAWDIYYCLKYYPGGNERLAECFRPHLANRLVLEGLDKISEKFASVDDYGPTAVAGFEELNDSEEREFKQRDGYERVRDLLTRLGLP
jgi:hypothetical protein